MPSLMLILACALWGLSFPLIKVLDVDQRARLPEVGGVFFATLLTGGLLILLANVLMQWKRPRHHCPVT
jgi:drug/metabolite transporter (DMT)-like permease